MSTISEKIQKVLNKAAGTNNAEEAATLMAKAHELLERHNIDLSELSSVEAAAQDDIDTSRDAFHFPVSMYYAVKLAAAVIRYYGCTSAYTRLGSRFSFHIVGRQSARDTVKTMWPYIIAQVRSQARLVAADTGWTKSKSETSVGNALSVRINRMWLAEQGKEEARKASGKNELVPVDAIKAASKAAFPHAREAKSRPTRYDNVGADAASKVSLNRPIGKRCTAAVEG